MNPLAEATPGFDDFVLTQQTPAIVYDVPRLRRTAAVLLDLCSPFAGQCFFSVKANRTPRILSEVANCGFGADVASGQELMAAVEAGHTQLVAVCPGLDLTTTKRVSEFGGLVFFDNTEQASAAQAQGVAIREHGIRVSLPGRYYRFGVRPCEIASVSESVGWTPIRFHFHYGEIENLEGLGSLLRGVDDVLEQFRADLVDLGGGYGVLSNDWSVMKAAFSCLSDFTRSRKIKLAFEFGKVVAARSAALVATVIARKVHGDRQILFVDASSYNLGTLERRRLRRITGMHERWMPTTVAGPTCYEDDVFVEGHPAAVHAVGDKVVFGLCGAYATSVTASLHGLPAPREIYFDP